MNQQPGTILPQGMAGGAPTPAPIHDIVGPLPFFQGHPWIIAAVVIALLASALLFFLWRRRLGATVTSPRESALLELQRLRASVTEGSDHDFGVVVSDVLRRFLGEALGLAAPRQTTEEFLGSLRGSLRFVPEEQASLAEFLSRSDFLKYARGEATGEQRLALIDAAESFVKGGGEAGKAANDAVAKEVA